MSANYNELEAYFKALATKHVYLKHTENEKHFYRIDMEEYLISESTLVYPYLSLERAEFGLSARNTDNISKKRSIAFMLADKYEGEDNFDSINQVYDNTEIVAEDIINRIQNDVENGNEPKLLRGFDINTVHIQHLPKHPTNLTCGVRVTFDILSAYDKTVNHDKWDDLT